jgi:phosphoribosylamine--glycine ligase
VVDLFRSRGLDCFGPTAGAAQLEGSKAFTKDFLARHKIPTADYQNFTEIEPALAYLREKGAPIVIKADGLAAGKGVIVAMTLAEAEDAVRDMLAGNAFGEAGSRVVIEEFLDGEEASFIVMVDGKNVLPMATSQDHKRVGDGDTGPNTGGMGAYSPAPVVTADVHQRVMDQVIWPTVRGMAEEGNVYTGFLYAGLMIDKAGNPKVIEFNCRFGDPETQPVMLRLQSSLVLLVEAAFAQALDKVEAQWDPRPSVGVVLAAGGYRRLRQGRVINGLDAAARWKARSSTPVLRSRMASRDRRRSRAVRHRHGRSVDRAAAGLQAGPKSTGRLLLPQGHRLPRHCPRAWRKPGISPFSRARASSPCLPIPAPRIVIFRHQPTKGFRRALASGLP